MSAEPTAVEGPNADVDARRRRWGGLARGVRRRLHSRPVRHLRRNRAGKIAGAAVLILVLVAIFAPALVPVDPAVQDLRGRYGSPSGDYWLGQDEFGRDLLSRLILGTRTSIWAIAQAVAVAVGLGVPLGLLAGYLGGWVDGLFSRVADALLAMPWLVLAMAIVAAMGPGLTNAMIAVGVISSPSLFRIARAAATTVRHADHIEAARSVGCSESRIILRHVLPNSISPLIVQLTFLAGGAIIAEASLSFLGLGVRPPTPSWGSLVRDGYNGIYETTFNIFPPSIVITIAILALTVLGDALRDAFSAGRES